MLLCGGNTSYGISELVREHLLCRYGKEPKFRARTAPTSNKAANRPAVRPWEAGAGKLAALLPCLPQRLALLS